MRTRNFDKIVLGKLHVFSPYFEIFFSFLFIFWNIDMKMDGFYSTPPSSYGKVNDHEGS